MKKLILLSAILFMGMANASENVCDATDVCSILFNNDGQISTGEFKSIVSKIGKVAKAGTFFAPGISTMGTGYLPLKSAFNEVLALNAGIGYELSSGNGGLMFSPGIRLNEAGKIIGITQFINSQFKGFELPDIEVGPSVVFMKNFKPMFGIMVSAGLPF